MKKQWKSQTWFGFTVSLPAPGLEQETLELCGAVLHHLHRHCKEEGGNQVNMTQSECRSSAEKVEAESGQMGVLSWSKGTKIQKFSISLQAVLNCTWEPSYRCVFTDWDSRREEREMGVWGDTEVKVCSSKHDLWPVNCHTTPPLGWKGGGELQGRMGRARGRLLTRVSQNEPEPNRTLCCHVRGAAGGPWPQDFKFSPVIEIFAWTVAVKTICTVYEKPILWPLRITDFKLPSCSDALTLALAEEKDHQYHICAVGCGFCQKSADFNCR